MPTGQEMCETIVRAVKLKDPSAQMEISFT